MPRPVYRLAITLGISLCVLNYTSTAGDSPGSSPAGSPASPLGGYLELRGTVDNENASDLFASLDADIHKNLAVLITAGRTQIRESTGDLKVETWEAGIRYTVSNRFYTQVRYNFTGKRNDIEVQQWALDLGWKTPSWSLTLTPEVRDLRLFVNPVYGVNRSVQSDAWGLGLSAAYLGQEDWEYHAGAHLYDYEKNVSNLANRRALLLLSGKALSVTSSFLDYSVNAGVTRLLDRSDLNLGWSHSKSAIDGSRSDTLSLQWVLHHYLPFRYTLEAGYIQSDTDSANAYASAGIGYSW